MSRRLRTLLFSTLYPSSARPVHGIFVETRLRELLKSGVAEARVIAPVPWFPGRGQRWGDYATIARTPPREERNGLDVRHPRYLVVPKVGMTLAPLLLALGSVAAVRQTLQEGFDFDLIDAHYYYPDGVAAAMLARWFNRPLTITARGTDLNLIPRYTLPRQMIRWAARRADASIGVCKALVEVLRGLGIPSDRLHVMRNGVDLERFHPVAAAEARRHLAVGGCPLLLSVGHLIERKGHHLVIEALAKLGGAYPDARLMIVGEGPERASLETLAHRLGVRDRVTLVGSVPNTDLYMWYSAADLVVLASSREGWANVLLESMACGTPVIATNIWGTPEVVATPDVGRLVDQRNAEAIAGALLGALAWPFDRPTIRRYAEGFSWRQTTNDQVAVFERIAQQSAKRALRVI